MQKQIQLTGERKWWGSDWIMIQNELWKVLEGWLSQYNQACILSGCVVTANGGNWDISAGIILIKDAAGVYQYAAFAGATAVTMPGYLVVNTANTNILYEDGNSKAKLTTNTAVFTNSVPGAGVDFVAMTSVGGKNWKAVTVGLRNTQVASMPSTVTITFGEDQAIFYAAAPVDTVINFNMAGAIAGSVVRIKFTYGSGRVLTISDSAGALTVITESGNIADVDNNTNLIYFMYCGKNEIGKDEIAVNINQY